MIVDGRRMVTKIRELGHDERSFEEKGTNLKYKNRNRIYTIHEGDDKRKSYPNVRLVMISILCLILPP